jgi:HK97 gp10 family phage protein
MMTMSGDISLVNTFRNLKTADGKAALRKGQRAAAKIIASRIKATAPEESGAIKRSVKVRAMKRSRVRIGVRVEVKAYYAGFVALGTKEIKANDFIQTAVSAAGSEAIEAGNHAAAAELEKRAAKK